MIEDFFVTPSNPAKKWFNRAVGKAFRLLPYQRRRTLIRRLLNGEGGVRWVENYMRESFDPSVHPKYTVVSAAVGAHGRVHWIGCCSGREVAHYAALYPAISFIASDMSASIVAWCRRHYTLPNLQFVQADAVTHDFEDELVVALGVLTYMDADEVCAFARRVRRLVAAEPVTLNYGAGSTTYRGRMAWNHPYRRVFDCRYYEEIPGDFGTSVVFTVGFPVEGVRHTGVA